MPHSILEDMAESKVLFTNQILELRRGAIVLAILSQLDRPQYGYGLLQSLESSGVPVDAGTLYPLLRRLEGQGVLKSSWETNESRPRKYYQMSNAGTKLYAELLEEWHIMTQAIEAMIKKGQL